GRLAGGRYGGPRRTDRKISGTGDRPGRPGGLGAGADRGRLGDPRPHGTDVPGLRRGLLEMNRPSPRHLRRTRRLARMTRAGLVAAAGRRGWERALRQGVWS